ncbi:16S rRNA (uracil(1498)-N(3))-methyltransferase [Actinomadura flavalba]|uniref:16S rRNA (uracil(1498)-N(3))-methyltransferase n=1 Tax=Actinomadura flavalba TaxID=1120938 RepID=UPI00037A21F9|nr:16S rRNA (uracil(1498)-N(3))-methyltransferase [Actinomadura flavalba]
MSAPVFLVETAALAGERVVLDGPEGRHAATVRRLRAGERIDLTDGAGLVVEGVVSGVERDALSVDVLARREVPAPAPRLVVVQALPKGERGELAVETMTEAGVDEIVPWAAERCVTRWKAERREKALGRWRNAAREAAKQARRVWLPHVTDLASTAAVAARLRDAGAAYVLHEGATDRLSAAAPPATGDIVLVVGPEGGVSDTELATFAAAGAGGVLLGPTVLRTSTAGVAALAVMSSLTGRW